MSEPRSQPSPLTPPMGGRARMAFSGALGAMVQRMHLDLPDEVEPLAHGAKRPTWVLALGAEADPVHIWSQVLRVEQGGVLAVIAKDDVEPPMVAGQRYHVTGGRLGEREFQLTLVAAGGDVEGADAAAGFELPMSRFLYAFPHLLVQ